MEEEKIQWRNNKNKKGDFQWKKREYGKFLISPVLI